MNDHAWIEWIKNGALLVLGSLAKMFYSDMKRLKETAVTSEEMAAAMRELKAERNRMHNQNREDLQYIRERVDKLVDRQIQD